ncbi:AraC family transcriptional regulator [Chryseobacterium sp. MYb264]|uniref:helix-turn-helix domain-containing protein n=1 Tax=Chryseobacterium sp. MYb264 TaxID=2745153 RepID=UPI002E124319|nr:AraC family transcriptional regulator [Chryseobacterium sp. MYb264]
MSHFEKISKLHLELGYKAPENPLFSILKCDENSCPGIEIDFTADFYIIGFRKLKSGSVSYGRTIYDHDSGSMSFVKPRQKMIFQNVQLQEKGFLILIHEDFLAGTGLYNKIEKYSYFDYEVNEALYLTPLEEETIWNLFSHIEKEYFNNVDTYSKEIILAHIETMLKYAQRFYTRQFINRKQINSITATKFNSALDTYFKNDMVKELGLPSVRYLSNQLNLSSRYLSDLLKQETGKTALELIHLYLMSKAKNLLKEGQLTISEISFSLGYENPAYFSKLFKKEVGSSPNEYKNNILN